MQIHSRGLFSYWEVPAVRAGIAHGLNEPLSLFKHPGQGDSLPRGPSALVPGAEYLSRIRPLFLHLTFCCTITNTNNFDTDIRQHVL